MRHLIPITLGITLLFLTGCPKQLDIDIPLLPGFKTSDEQRIQTLLDNVAKAVEGRKTSRVMQYISKNYQDADGRDYAGIQVYLNRLFRDYREVRIRRSRPSVQVDGDRAMAIETFGTEAVPFNAGDNPPINIQGQMNVMLEKAGTDWRIVEWGQLQ